MALDLIIPALVLVALSGIPGLLSLRLAFFERLSTVIMVAGSVMGIAGSFAGLGGGVSSPVSLPWQAAGGSSVGLDPLSAFFLVPVFLIGGLGSWYGLGYWNRENHPAGAGVLRLFWGLAVAGMGLLVISIHAVSFLLGWELMALSAFFLIVSDDRSRECRKSGLVYLIATHMSTLLLFALFALWRYATGSFDFVPMRGSVDPLLVTVLFFLAFAGFGLKAGMMPLHFWLPGAHANAPSHVSALMSGVLIKMGIYGLVRMTMLLPQPPVSWGALILFSGGVSGILGVVFALAQHDLKKLLAYHSVENIGIILMGLGLSLIGRSIGREDLTVLGMASSLLHVWNHALFKPLLFMGAGSVLKATGTRRIDHLGGLGRTMPLTSFLFLIGAVAISGIPPLNGFISEFILYLGFFSPLTGPGGGEAVVVAAPVLAMIGALATACFVKVFGAVFLGTPRSSASPGHGESSWHMVVPMLVLALACSVVGLMPQSVVPFLGTVTGSAALENFVPFTQLGFFIPGTLLLVILAAVMLRPLWKNRTGSVTWDCGYAEPTGRMQYTASSFARSIVKLFGAVVRPSEQVPALGAILPASARLESHVDEPVLDRLIRPFVSKVRQGARWFGRFQQGLVQQYLMYMFAAVLALCATRIPFREIIAGFFQFR